MPSITPLKTVLTEVVPGLNICSVFPFSPPWTMIASARIVIAVNEIAANVEHQPDREPDADVVQDEHQRQEDQGEEPPGREVEVGDVLRPRSPA